MRPMRTTLLAVPALALTLAACGSSEQQQAQEAAAKMEQGAQQVQQAAEQMAEGAQASSEQMAKGLAQMAQGFQQMAQGSAKPVDFEQLKAVLPEVNGWTMGDARGEQMNMPVAISRAEAQYRRDTSRVELEIVDSALSQLLLAPMSMFLSSGYSERSDDGFKRATKIGGHPGMEDWNTRTRRGEVTAVVANRFIVKATGHSVESLDQVRSVLDAVDFAKLATLK
jgi:hypothetical protein